MDYIYNINIGYNTKRCGCYDYFGIRGNKVEGMALAKVSALVMVGLIIPFVITDSIQYVFSFIPSFG